VPAGWTIQQITHCSVGLACSNSLVNRSSASALGEADPTTAATIVKQARKTAQATAVATTATIRRGIGKTLANYAPAIVDLFIVDQAVVDGSGAPVSTTATITRGIGKSFSTATATAATIVKRAGKALAGTPVVSGATLTPQYLHLGVTNPQALSASVATGATLTPLYLHAGVTSPQALTATVVTTASLDAAKVTPVIPGGDQQGVSALVAAVGGGIGA